MLRKFTPSPAMVVAVTALVMACAGTGYAAMKLPAKSVGTPQLRNNAITTPKLKNGAVTATKLKPGSIRGDQIAAESIGGTQISETTLGTVPSAVTAASAPVAGLNYQARHENLPAGMGMTSHIECPPDRRPVSGGARMDNALTEFVIDGFPQGNGWTSSAANSGFDDSGFSVYVVCAQAAPGTAPAPKTQAKPTTSRFRVSH
jgi:hypothetical protein